MRIVVASDHGGFNKKAGIVALLRRLGHQVKDLGCHTEDSCDYPDYALQVGRAVGGKKADRGILVCGTGIGMAIAANKVPRVRAAVCWDARTAALAAEHNDANVLCLSGRFLPKKKIEAMVKTWLATPFGGGRHERRVGKIAKIEKSACK